MTCPNCGSVQAYDASSCAICGYDLEVHKTGVKLSSLSDQKIVIRSYSALFDRKKFGINFLIGIGYLIASMLAIFTWRIVLNIMGYQHDFSRPFNFYLIIFAFNFLEATLLVLLNHGIKKEWALIGFFSLVLVVFGVLLRLTFNTITIAAENMRFASPFEIQSIIFNFIWAILTIGGLVLLVKLWGPQLWSFVLGMMSIFLFREILYQIYYITRGSSFSFSNLIAPAIDGLILGGLIYVGLALHLKQKGYELIGGNLYLKHKI